MHPWNKQLRLRRVTLDLTQAQAADLIGVSLGTYGRWERGAHKPMRAHQTRIAQTFEVDAHDVSNNLNICANCHWYKPDREYAHIINCLEHFDYHDKTDTCDSFCENGKYVPTGVWAGMTKVVKAVSEEVKKREDNQ